MARSLPNPTIPVFRTLLRFVAPAPISRSFLPSFPPASAGLGFPASSPANHENDAVVTELLVNGGSNVSGTSTSTERAATASTPGENQLSAQATVEWNGETYSKTAQLTVVEITGIEYSEDGGSTWVALPKDEPADGDFLQVCGRELTTHLRVGCVPDAGGAWHSLMRWQLNRPESGFLSIDSGATTSFVYDHTSPYLSRDLRDIGVSNVACNSGPRPVSFTVFTACTNTVVMEVGSTAEDEVSILLEDGTKAVTDIRGALTALFPAIRADVRNRFPLDATATIFPKYWNFCRVTQEAKKGEIIYVVTQKDEQGQAIQGGRLFSKIEVKAKSPGVFGITYVSRDDCVPGNYYLIPDGLTIDPMEIDDGQSEIQWFRGRPYAHVIVNPATGILPRRPVDHTGKKRFREWFILNRTRELVVPFEILSADKQLEMSISMESVGYISPNWRLGKKEGRPKPRGTMKVGDKEMHVYREWAVFKCYKQKKVLGRDRNQMPNSIDDFGEKAFEVVVKRKGKEVERYTNFVKVFFNGQEPNYNPLKNTISASVPNWFYYFRQIVPGMEVFVYEHTEAWKGIFHPNLVDRHPLRLGKNAPGELKPFRAIWYDRNGRDTHKSHWISGFSNARNRFQDENTPPPSAKGIDACYKVVVHERRHRSFYPNGFQRKHAPKFDPDGDKVVTVQEEDNSKISNVYAPNSQLTSPDFPDCWQMHRIQQNNREKKKEIKMTRAEIEKLTYYRVGDQEYFAWREEEVVTEDSVRPLHKRDWSAQLPMKDNGFNVGKQWGEQWDERGVKAVPKGRINGVYYE